MIRKEMPRNFNFGMAAFGLAIGASVAILAAGATTVVAPTSAQASAKFTAQTKQPCTRCHMAAKGASADNLLPCQPLANRNTSGRTVRSTLATLPSCPSGTLQGK